MNASNLKPFYGETSNQVIGEVKNKNEESICIVKGEWNGVLEFDYQKRVNLRLKTFSKNSLKNKILLTDNKG